jgi:hypothetical protein
MNWLKRLFGMMDRMDAASDRAAAAMENIALTLERADTLIAQRFGFEAPPAAAPLPPGAVQEDTRLPDLGRGGLTAPPVRARLPWPQCPPSTHPPPPDEGRMRG